MPDDAIVQSLRAQLAELFGPWVLKVSSETLRVDLLAGLLSAVLALPQAIAFAALAGLPPQYGLYSAVVPCVVAALFGSSWHVVSGPTNSNSLALLAMLSPLAMVGGNAYIQLALAVTIIVGLMQWLVGVLRIGSVANFISPSALFGFTSGASVLIVVYALKDLLALNLPPGSGAVGVLTQAARQLSVPPWAPLLVGVTTLAIAALARARARPWPFMLIGLASGTLVAWAVNRNGLGLGLTPVQVLGSIPTPVPPFGIPQIDWHRLPELAGIAFALTIVALGQSISIAKAVAERSGQRIDANREFVGQGLSNVVGGLFSSYVSCGSLNRSFPNLEAGARTPLAAVFSSVWVLSLVAISAPLIGMIPAAATAGLLVLVAWSLFDAPRWRRLRHTNPREFAIALATLLATLCVRLDVAILFGTIAALVSYLHRTSRPALRTMGLSTTDAQRQFVVIDDRREALLECPQAKLLRVEGSVYFGAVQHVADRLHAMREAPDPQRHLLVMGKSMNFIDQSGADLWEAELVARRRMGGDLYFHRPRPAVEELWKRTGFIERLGANHIFPDKRTAIAGIFGRLEPETCRRCTVRPFRECASVETTAAALRGQPVSQT